MAEQEISIQDNRLPIEEWEELAKEGFDYPMPFYSSGISMWPLLRAKDDYVKIVYPRRELKIGDIIVFHRTDGKDVAHRLRWMDEKMMETIGDNCDKPDERFPRTSVFGLVTHVCRKGREICVDTGFWRFYGRVMLWTNPFRMFIRNKLFRPFRRFMIWVIKGKKV